MVRVLHVICDCNGGGAERIALELAARGGHTVAPIYEGGDLEPEFRARVRLEPLGAIRRRRVVGAFARLVRLARDGSLRLAAAICRRLAAVTVPADASAFCRLLMSSVGLKATCEVGVFGSTVAS